MAPLPDQICGNETLLCVGSGLEASIEVTTHTCAYKRVHRNFSFAVSTELKAPLTCPANGRCFLSRTLLAFIELPDARRTRSPRGHASLRGIRAAGVCDWLSVLNALLARTTTAVTILLLLPYADPPFGGSGGGDSPQN